MAKNLVSSNSVKVQSSGDFIYLDSNTYSTNEEIIGTWTDNKPIYRKVIYINLPSGTGWNLNFLSLSNINEIINLNGTIGKGTLLPYYEPNYEVFFTFDSNSQYLRCYQSSTVFNNNNIKLIIEYTKTTD